jgi:hypothetical protein
MSLDNYMHSCTKAQNKIIRTFWRNSFKCTINMFLLTFVFHINKVIQFFVWILSFKIIWLRCNKVIACVCSCFGFSLCDCPTACLSGYHLMDVWEVSGWGYDAWEYSVQWFFTREAFSQSIGGVRTFKLHTKG